MKYLITGSAGFIGKHLVKRLLKENHYIFSIDRKDIGFKHKNLKHAKKDLTKIKRFPSVDIVIHLAAYNGTRFFSDDPLNVMKDNFLSTVNLVDFYKNKNLKNFIYAGTPESIAGATDLFGLKMPCKESYPYVFDSNVRWSYGMSKTLGELYITSVKWKYKVIRYFNVYGPGQVEHFIPDFIESVIAGKPKLKGYKNTRSFLYIDDAISLTLKVIKERKLQNEIVNVGSALETSILDVAKKIMNIMKCKKKLVLEDHPKGSVLRRCPDTNKIKNILHFSPKTTLDEGLKRTIKSLI